MQLSTLFLFFFFFEGLIYILKSKSNFTCEYKSCRMYKSDTYMREDHRLLIELTPEAQTNIF